MLEDPEFEFFLEGIKDRSIYTQKAYKTSYRKLREELGDSPIHEVDQSILVDIAKEVQNPHSRHAIINIAVIVRKLYDLPITQLEVLRDINKKDIEKRTRAKNKELKLPSYDDLIEHMNKKFDENKWTDYIINYLLINFQVRNQDLNFEVVKLKRDTKKNKEINYIWFNRTKGTALYIRNRYKTSGTYGVKENEIDDKKFVTAIKRVMAHNNHGEEAGVFIPNDNAIAYHIKKATYKEIGESSYVKIILDHFKADWEKHDEIARNRGTDIKTIRTYYNINKK